MSYNVHHGEGVDGRIELLRLAQVMRRERVDLVALQEVDKGVQRTGRRDLPAELAVLTGMTCLFSNNFPYQGGEYGNAILTRFPVVRWENRHYRMLRPGEQRGLLQAALKVQGRRLVFMSTHLDYRRDDAERLQNVLEIQEAVRKHGNLPAIVCGDFNDFPDSRVYRAMTESLNDVWKRAGEGDGFTFPSGKPDRRIDYIFVSDTPRLSLLKAWVPESEASDHRPVVAELRFH